MPKRASARNEKQVLDYNQGRELGDLMRYATSTMPNYVERIGSEADHGKLRAKAAEWGLPLILVFSDKAAGKEPSTTLKALSSEFRRRVLIAEVRKHERTAGLANGLEVSSYPTLLCLGAKGSAQGSATDSRKPLRFEGKQPTHGRLNTFIGKCALGKPVASKPKPEPSSAEGKQEL